jgi:chromosome segregation ATPase
MKKETVGELERNIKKTECDRARIERELNDEMEGLKQAKKKLKQTVDEKTKEMNARETEITNLEREVKSLLQVRRRRRIESGARSFGESVFYCVRGTDIM